MKKFLYITQKKKEKYKKAIKNKQQNLSQFKQYEQEQSQLFQNMMKFKRKCYPKDINIHKKKSIK